MSELTIKTPGFDLGEWFTPHSYSDNFRALPNSSGVYALVLTRFVNGFSEIEMSVLYVGMSKDIAERIYSHPILTKLRKKHADRFEHIHVYFREVPRDQIRDEERRLIRAFDPPYNSQLRDRGL